MKRLRTIGFAICLSAGVIASAVAAQTPSIKDSIAQQEQKLAQARANHDMRSVVTELNILGSLYRLSGQLQKALDDLNEALPIEQQANSQFGQGTTLMTMGRVYTDLGQEDKALALLNQALAMWRSLGSHSGEAATLSYIGKVYNNLGDHDESLKNLNASMAIWHQIDSPTAAPSAGTPQATASRTMILDGEAGALDNLGRAYSDMGQGLEALKDYDQAITLFRQAGERNGEALVLNDMGPAYAELGQKQKALEVYNQAIQIWHETGNRQGEALTLNDIGRLYRDLGQHQTAMDYYNQALPIWRETGNRSGEAMALSDIGLAYAYLGQPQKALDYGSQALPIFRETGNRRGEAMVLNTMGRDHSDMHDAQAAMDLDMQALVLWRATKDERNEATALMTIAWAYSEMNEPEQSFASAIAALGLAKDAGDPEIEAAIENSMMLGFRKQHRPEEAILFGLDAVNSYQQIRKNISGLNKELQAGFVQSKSQVYRMLAELLIEAGRLGEAEQILDLLKEQELKDLVAGASANGGAGFEPIALSPAQQKAESALPDLEKKARTIEELSLACAQIEAKPTHTPEDDAQLKSLEANMAQVSKEIHDTMYNEIFPLLDAQSAPGQAADTTKSLLQNSMAKLGPNVMGIRLLLGDDHAYAIVITASSRKKIELPVSSADLRAKALEALHVLSSPATDPRPQLNQLYAMIVTPLESDLKKLPATQGNVPTLLWSLDDALRYVPMGALYDGNHYMVERFHNVLFTPESYGHMSDSPLASGQAPHALAMGLSKSYGGMPALPGVLPELDSVVHDPAAPDSHGPMQGILLPDQQFTLAALKSELESGQEFSVVHIASHFVLIAGSGDEPYLLMGGDKTGDPNGFDWNLSDMENSTVAFHGTRLLTLSACSTAKDYRSRNGLEMDGLGMVAQQKQAEAVLATLWDVNDLSTSHIMSDFYVRWMQNPAQGKAEALRQAQLAFLQSGANATRPAAASHSAVAPRSGATSETGVSANPSVAADAQTSRGSKTAETTPGTQASTGASAGPTVAGGAQTGRGFKTSEPAATQSSLGYAHPYYWAPFVLIGNYQ